MALFEGNGNIAAALTPFDGSGAVDRAAFDRQLDMIAIHAPLAVSVVGVEVQDYHVLDAETRVDLTHTTAQRMDVPVVAGVSSPSLATAIELSERMADAGATAVIAVAAQKPWGAPPTPSKAVRWFHGLADRSPLDVVLYNNPRAGVDLDVDTMRHICEHDTVVALKETSRNVGKTLMLCRNIDRAGHAAVFTNMESLHATLAAGGRGAMLPPPGLRVANEIVRAHDAGDLQRARELQDVFAEFPGRWMRLGLGPVMKAAMREIGCPVGDPLPPYEALTDDECRDIAAFLAGTGVVG